MTGTAGFTGRYLLRHAKARNHEIVALKSDITDPQALERELCRIETCDAVVHLAAISHVAIGETLDYYRVNVIGTSNVLMACMKMRSPPKRVLVASSANIYGNTKNSPVSESTPPAPVNDYASSKLAMEFMAQTFRDKVDLILVRPFNYTGPGQATTFLIPKLVRHFRDREPVIKLGNLDVAREYNDVNWVCNTYLDFLESTTTGVFNVCSGVAHELKTVVETLQRLTGHSIRIDVDPLLVRRNEIKALYGDPQKMQTALGTKANIMQQSPLSQLLESMLNQ